MGPASALHSRSAVLASIDFFAPLSPSERDALAAAAHPQSYAPGEDLFQEGETCRGIGEKEITDRSTKKTVIGIARICTDHPIGQLMRIRALVYAQRTGNR